MHFDGAVVHSSDPYAQRHCVRQRKYKLNNDKFRRPIRSAILKRRLDDMVKRARGSVRKTADAARKAGAFFSFWTFMPLLFGGRGPVAASRLARSRA
jgi:hypothetical protein